MGAKTILHPTDFSGPSDIAFEYAANLARDAGATLLILHVAEPPFEFRGPEEYAGDPDPDNPAMLEQLRSIVPSVQSVPYEHCVLAGDPAYEIVEFAEAKQVEMIVMGAHDRGRLHRLLRGSVVDYVVRHATRPVLVVK